MRIEKITFDWFWGYWTYRWGKASPLSILVIEIGPMMIMVFYA